MALLGGEEKTSTQQTLFKREENPCRSALVRFIRFWAKEAEFEKAHLQGQVIDGKFQGADHLKSCARHWGMALKFRLNRASRHHQQAVEARRATQIIEIKTPGRVRKATWRRRRCAWTAGSSSRAR